jgi:c(7)-type cytochrome triheme protein
MSPKKIGSILFVLVGSLYAHVGSGACRDTPGRWSVDAGQGLVTDMRTGLTWMRCALGQTWDGSRCADAPQWYTWHSWKEALEGARDNRHAGFTDWRVPSIDELESLVAPCGRPSIDAQAFPGTPAALFWSATPSADNAEYAWRVDFSSGRSNADLKRSVSYRVRLVRGAPWTPPATKAEVEADAEVELATAHYPRELYAVDSPQLALLQPAPEALAAMPRTAYGSIDWSAALQLGVIAPRSDLDGSGAMTPFDLTIVMKNTGAMDHVRFPHRQHTEWLTCSNCHPEIFIPRASANPISMGAVLRGEYCGRCHGRVAFSTLECDRCHALPQTAKGK